MSKFAGSKVLIYAMNYAPELIGCGRYTGEIGTYLASAGVNAEVVTTPPHYPGWVARDGYKATRYVTEIKPGLRITRCPIGLSKNMRGFGRIWASLSFALSSGPVVVWRILWFRPDYVLCVEPTLFASPAALLAAKLVGAKSILHVQDLEIDAAFAVGHIKSGLLKSMAHGFEHLVSRMFDRVVTISDKMRERLQSKGVKERNLRVVRNWVDVSHLYPLQGPNEFRSELGFSDDTFVALYSGNIGVKQALHLVMDVARASLGNKRVKFVIVGDGPEKAGLVAEDLPNVIFLPLQPEHRLNMLLNLADVHLLPQSKGVADLVLPSKIGGMLASGKPILAMADKGTEVHTFLNGYAETINAGDATAMTRALERLSEQKAPSDDRRETQRQALLAQLTSKDLISRLLYA